MNLPLQIQWIKIYWATHQLYQNYNWKESKLNIKFVTITSKEMTDLLNKQISKLKLEGGIYFITCYNCHKEYIGETSTNLNKNVYKHKMDLL